MDLLSALRIFVRISQTGSFSAVAREVGTTQPAISRQVAQLEQHLGARLFQRSTRSLALTEDGRDLLGHAQGVIDAVAQTEAAIGRRRTQPTGTVRISAPASFAQVYVAPKVGLLLARYPELTVELLGEDNVVDMVQDGIDVAIRVGEVSDSGLVARRIGSTSVFAMASAAYLDRAGEPAAPADLADHECLLFTRVGVPGEWSFVGPDGPVTIGVHGRLRSNNIEALAAAMLADQGIARLPTWMVRDQLASGEVRRILSDWRPNPRPISAVYPSRRFLAPRTRVVIDFLVDEFRLDPAISAYGEA